MSPPKSSTKSPSGSSSPEPALKRKAATKDDIKDEHAPSELETKRPKTETTRPAAVEWLLTDEAFSLAFPSLPPGHGEIDWEAGHAQPQKTPPPEDAGKKKPDGDEQTPLLTYPDSSLTPFQNLTAALLLSKPISHRLGLRTINTLLNPPFGLRTLKDLDEAGFEGRRKVVWEARTQHKEKTAAQLGDLVQSVRDICGVEGDEDVEEMEGLRAQINDLKTPEEAQKKVEKILTDGVKGIGPTGAGIFLRRVQERWEEVFPYADKRALEVAVRFGILKEGDGAEELAEKVDGDRARFVRLLDVLVGIQLEKKTEEALAAAGVTK